MPNLSSEERYDLLYRKIRANLAAEFHPRGFSREALVDSLAADYVRVARVHQMLEIQQAPSVSKDNQRTWKLLRHHERDLHRVQATLNFVSGKSTEPCSSAEAKKLAERIEGAILQLEDDLAEEAQRAAEPVTKHEGFPPMPPGMQALGASEEFVATFHGEDDDFAKQRELLALIAPAREKLLDAAYVSSILSGKRRMNRTEKAMLDGLLNEIGDGIRFCIESRGNVKTLLREKHAEFQIAMAASPEGMVRLDRYLGRIERRIERKIVQLQGR